MRSSLVVRGGPGVLWIEPDAVLDCLANTCQRSTILFVDGEGVHDGIASGSTPFGSISNSASGPGVAIADSSRTARLTIAP